VAKPQRNFTVPQIARKGDQHHEDQDEHESRQRSLGWLNLNATSPFHKLQGKETNTMKIKTNTKAGSAVWGG
jgi:hypothetical protein